MNVQPTLLVIADIAPSLGVQKQATLTRLQETLYNCLASKLPLKLIAPRFASIWAQQILSVNDIIEFPEQLAASRRDRFALAVSHGVLESADSNGWIILNTQLYSPTTKTLINISKILNHQVIVYFHQEPQNNMSLGFSAELFSELIKVRSLRDLSKLVKQYPQTIMGVENHPHY